MTPAPGPALFGPRRARSARRKLTPELFHPHLSDRPFAAALAAHPAAAPDHPDRNVAAQGCTIGSRGWKASYLTEAAALACAITAAARGLGQGAERRWAIYACQDHWHMTGYGERTSTNMRLHPPAPSLAHPRPVITDPLTRV
jgi:hypothetical protein